MLPCKTMLPLLAAGLLASPSAVAAAPADADWYWRFAAGAAKPHEHEWAGAYTVGLERHWREGFGGRISWDLTLTGIDARDEVSVALDRRVWLLGAGTRWRHGGWFSGFATALATARTAAISGPVQFVTTVGYSWERWGVYAQHVSNAGFKGRNWGETMLMVELTPQGRPR